MLQGPSIDYCFCVLVNYLLYTFRILRMSGHVFQLEVRFYAVAFFRSFKLRMFVFDRHFLFLQAYTVKNFHKSSQKQFKILEIILNEFICYEEIR